MSPLVSLNRYVALFALLETTARDPCSRPLLVACRGQADNDLVSTFTSSW